MQFLAFRKELQYSTPCRLQASLTRSSAGMRTRFARCASCFDRESLHQNKNAPNRVRFCFGTMCSACAERDAHCVRDVAFGSDVHFAREDAEHITSLCAEGAIHHCGEAITSLRRSRYITLYKRPKVCYNKIKKAVEIWQKQLCQNKNSSINASGS